MPAALPADHGARAVTREIPDDTDMEVIELETTDLVETGPPRRPAQHLDTAEIDWGRDRRVTIISTIPAEIAAGMLTARPAIDDDDDDDLTPTAGFDPARVRDPAAPQPEPIPARINQADQHTRRVGDSDRQPLAAGSGKVGDKTGDRPGDKSGGQSSDRNADPDGIARRRQRAATLIDRARAALDEGNLTAAVDAAEGAMREADEAPPPGIVEVIEPARPLLTRVFAAYVGPLTEVPVLAPRAPEIARDRLAERERVLIKRIDGLRTLEELFDGSGLGSTDALRIAAQLIRTGAIRVI